MKKIDIRICLFNIKIFYCTPKKLNNQNNIKLYPVMSP